MAATPIHFGDSDRKLYGVYHEAERRAPNAPACLMFNPFGEEAIRAHRIFKQLAERLARTGAPVLRFDYYGSGDSDGECAAFDFDGMVRDALTAQEELEALSGARRFVWIGLGLGGAAALRAASEARLRLAKIFLWDPALSGAEYLSGLRRAHVASLSKALDLPAARLERETPEDLTEAMGFCLPPALSTQLKAFHFEGAKQLARECHLIRTSGTGAAEQAEGALRDIAPAFFCHDDDAADWNSEKAMNAYFVPPDVLDYVAENAGGAP